MKKKDEINDPNSCLSKAGDDEIIFVLRAKDPVAPDTIRMWLNLRVIRGHNEASDKKIHDARSLAEQMELQQQEMFGFIDGEPPSEASPGTPHPGSPQPPAG